GIRGGPTGLLSLVAVPLAAIDAGPYTALAAGWAEQGGAEILDEPAVGPSGETLPLVQAVRVTPTGAALRSGGRIAVGVDGTAGCRAEFDWGSLRVAIPMAAGEAVRGGIVRYRGSYVVREVDAITDAAIVASLHDHRLPPTRVV